MTGRILITGCGGLIGSTAVRHFHNAGWEVTGVDCDKRAAFFGQSASVSPVLRGLTDELQERFDLKHLDIAHDDLPDREWDAIVHCAAQPSHDYANDHELEDFDTNAVGTLRLLCHLDASRKKSGKRPVFVLMSTNKVYGDAPNRLPTLEQETRYDYSNVFYDGVPETMSIDQSGHSVFGVSKAAADLMVQEFQRQGRFRTVCFRAGCLTGEGHQGAKLHGFLSYLGKCLVRRQPYTVIGYKGKQVRDNLHAVDMVSAIHEAILNEQVQGVYNIGGGRENSCSVLEAIQTMEEVSDLKLDWTLDPQPRFGDHLCYITDLGKFRRACPNWRITYSLFRIYQGIIEAELQACRSAT